MPSRQTLFALIFILLTTCSAVADVITLSTGESLNVSILESTDEFVRVIHPVLGELTIARSDIVSISPSTQPAVQHPPAPPQQPPPPPTTAPWDFKLSLATGAATGNTDNANFTTILTAARETPRIKTLLDAGYFFTQSDGDRSQNRFTAGGRNDWLNVGGPESKIFFFADARFDHDEFQSWDSRINGHLGIGYRLLQPADAFPKTTLNLLAGLGAVKEFGSANDDVRPEALVGVELKHEFTAKHSLNLRSTIFPDLSGLGEYRWLNEIGWQILIDTADSLSLTAGLQHEYQSQVDPGREHSDLRVFAGLQLDF